MTKEDKKIQENLVNEMMKVSKTNPDVMIYMQSLMKCYEDLEKENQQLKKQKDHVVEYIKSLRIYGLRSGKMLVTKILNKILRMLGEKDE